MGGYIPIPSPRSSLSRGCFDPLVATQTVGGQCRCSDDDDDGYPAHSHHDKIPPWWENVSNDKRGNMSATKSHHIWKILLGIYMSQSTPYNNGKSRKSIIIFWWGPNFLGRENLFWDSLSISVPTIQNRSAFSWKQELQERAHFLKAGNGSKFWTKRL